MANGNNQTQPNAAAVRQFVSSRVPTRKPDIFDQVAQGGRNGRDIFDEVAGPSNQPFVPPDTTAQAKAYAMRPLTQAKYDYPPTPLVGDPTMTGARATVAAPQVSPEDAAKLRKEVLVQGALTLGTEGLGALIPNAARAGANFERVAAAMKNADAPVVVSESKLAASKAAGIISRGGKPSKLISDFLEAAKGRSSLTWEEARDFLSNASSRGRLAELIEGQTGHARHAIGEFVEKLGDDVLAGARSVGKGELYLQAMKEYRAAKTLSRVLKASALIGGGYLAKQVADAGTVARAKALYDALI